MLVLPQNNKLVLISNQPTIMVAMDKQPVAYTAQTRPQPQPKTNDHQTPSPPDRSSMEGKFGWHQFGDKAIPYLFRAEQKYVSLKMILVRVYDAYKKYFTNEVYGCCDINLVKMTDCEARLLTEINVNHCDGLFGQLIFTKDDDLVTIKDAINMHHFLQFSYEKLVRKNEQIPKLCGFIQINKQNCIPYVANRGNNRLYVPLIYFDGEYVFLEQRSIELKGWSLAFLKLCCKIHGIGKSSFDKKSMAVVDLELVKKFFPPETLFDDSWPVENKLDCLLVQRNESVMPAKVQSQVDLTKNVAKRSTNNYRRPSPPPYTAKPVQNALRPNIHPITNVANALRPVNDAKTGLAKFQIPDYNIPDNGGYPYFVLRTQCGQKFLHFCINSMPFDSSNMLVTLEEAAMTSQIALELFLRAIDFLKFPVYLPNTSQQRQLAMCKMDRTMGLISVYGFISSFDTLKNVCTELAAKRS